MYAQDAFTANKGQHKIVTNPSHTILCGVSQQDLDQLGDLVTDRLDILYSSNLSFKNILANEIILHDVENIGFTGTVCQWNMLLGYARNVNFGQKLYVGNRMEICEGRDLQLADHTIIGKRLTMRNEYEHGWSENWGSIAMLGLPKQIFEIPSFDDTDIHYQGFCQNLIAGQSTLHDPNQSLSLFEQMTANSIDIKRQLEVVPKTLKGIKGAIHVAGTYVGKSARDLRQNVKAHKSSQKNNDDYLPF